MRVTDLARPAVALLDWALPPRCPACGVPVPASHRFCARCWGGMRFLTPPWCDACNRPVASAVAGATRCARCIADPPRHAGVRAAVAYGPAARGIALRLKYGGRVELADTVARPMRRLMPDDADLLVPVPLHRWRLWRRGFNQALLIARAVGKATGVPVAATVLERHRATPALRDMGPAARRRAIAGAFQVPPSARAQVAGKKLVLIDDVHTSGATSDACVRVLLSAGAHSVTILCWARVLDDEPSDGAGLPDEFAYGRSD